MVSLGTEAPALGPGVIRQPCAARPANTPRNFHGRRQSGSERPCKIPRGSRKARAGSGLRCPAPRDAPRREGQPALPPCQPGPRGSPQPSYVPRTRTGPSACPRTSSASSSTRLPTSAMLPSAAAARPQGTQNRLCSRLGVQPSADGSGTGRPSYQTERARAAGPPRPAPCRLLTPPTRAVS